MWALVQLDRHKPSPGKQIQSKFILKVNNLWRHNHFAFHSILLNIELVWDLRHFSCNKMKTLSPTSVCIEICVQTTKLDTVKSHLFKGNIKLKWRSAYAWLGRTVTSKVLEEDTVKKNSYSSKIYFHEVSTLQNGSWERLLSAQTFFYLCIWSVLNNEKRATKQYKIVQFPKEQCRPLAI